MSFCWRSILNFCLKMPWFCCCSWNKIAQNIRFRVADTLFLHLGWITPCLRPLWLLTFFASPSNRCSLESGLFPLASFTGVFCFMVFVLWPHRQYMGVDGCFHSPSWGSSYSLHMGESRFRQFWKVPNHVPFEYRPSSRPSPHLRFRLSCSHRYRNLFPASIFCLAVPSSW